MFVISCAVRILLSFFFAIILFHTLVLVDPLRWIMYCFPRAVRQARPTPGTWFSLELRDKEKLRALYPYTGTPVDDIASHKLFEHLNSNEKNKNLTFRI